METEQRADSIELEQAIEKKNYALAVRLAGVLGKPAEEIRKLEREAIKQMIVECRNADGVKSLAQAYRMSGDDLRALLREIVKEAGERKVFDKRQFDIKTMRYLSLEEWVREHFPGSL